MRRKCVVILSDQALLAEGIASRLREYLQCVSLEIVNRREAGAMAQITALGPSIVILDVTDSEIVQSSSLSALLLAFPGLPIIRLDPEQEQIQLVTSETHRAVEVRDLAKVVDAYLGGPPLE
jgi:hypothetical protein